MKIELYMKSSCIEITSTLVKILKGFKFNNPQWSETKLGVKNQVITGTLPGFNNRTTKT